MVDPVLYCRIAVSQSLCRRLARYTPPEVAVDVLGANDGIKVKAIDDVKNDITVLRSLND
jgi:hypothetical protein